LKTVDALIGPLALKFAVACRLGEKKTFTNQKTNKVLVIRPGGIGDAALLLPALKVLKEIIPTIQTHILCEPRNAGVFTHSPFVPKIFNYNRLSDLKEIRETQYDCIFDTEQSHFLTGTLVTLLKGHKKIGFATRGRESAYDVSVQYHQDEYEAESFFRLFAAGIENWPEKFRLRPTYFFPTNKEKERIKALLSDIRRELVCIFPGASIREKLWPAYRWSQVADELWEMGRQPTIIGGKAEMNISQKIMDSANSPILNLCGRLSLSETAAIFNHSRLLISTDSGILHIGAMCNIHTVSLFGPSFADKWGPKGKKHKIINKNLECSPCTKFATTPPCSNNMACMMEISNEEVLKVSKDLL